MGTRDSGRSLDTPLSGDGTDFCLDEGREGDRTPTREIIALALIAPFYMAGVAIKNAFLYFPRRIKEAANQAAGYDNNEDSTPTERRHAGWDK